MISSENRIQLHRIGSALELSNGLVKARFEPHESGIQQKYFAWRASKWVTVVESFVPPEQRRLYWRAPVLHDSDVNRVYRLLVSEGLRSIETGAVTETSGTVLLTGKLGDHLLQQSVSLQAGEDCFHIEVAATLAENQPRLEYLLSTFTFHTHHAPEFIHTPTLKYEEEDILGDRVFHSPAIILQEEGLFCALVPDLDRINDSKVLSSDARQHTTGTSLQVSLDPNRVSMPTGLDLTFQSPLTSRPLLSYGFMDAVATHHMHWVHRNDGSMVRRLKSNRLLYGFDLFVSASAPKCRGYQRVSRYLWQRYGSRYFRAPKPQSMPFTEYARVIYPAACAYKGGNWGWQHTAPPEFEEMESWVQWEMEGLPVGGFRNNAPMWYDMLSNSPWWNNVRDAVGLYFWGKRLNEANLVEKARRIINLALLAPQKAGLFATIYRIQRKQWVASHFDPPQEVEHNVRPPGFLVGKDTASYHTISCSLTAGHLLRYRKLCEADSRILPYVRLYGDFLCAQVDRQGRVPAWFSADLKPNAHLLEGGEGGAHLWFLAELYLTTRDRRYLETAKRIACYIIQEVLPNQRWRDIECYFSCGGKPLNYRDTFQQMEPRGNLAMFWAADGFASLFEATGERAYLEAGERVIDYVALYQTVWAPHYIWAYAFGAWASDNGDAAWLNAHQAWITGALVWYGKQLGRQDLLERGVAAARAAVVLINHPAHIGNDIYPYPNYPFGLGPENIDHEGFAQNCGRTSACCGEESGVSAGIGDVLRALGGAYVDFEKGLAVGVDGIAISSVKREGRRLEIQIENKLSALPVAYEQPFDIELRIVGLSEGDYELVIHGEPPRTVDASQLQAIPVQIKPAPASPLSLRQHPVLPDPPVETSAARGAAVMRWHRLQGPDVTQVAHRGAPSWLNIALEYVRQTPNTRVSDWAKAVGFSPAQFRRVFQKWMGLSPRAYVQYQRLEEATRLLENTDLKIEVIAERLGFDSLPHFTRLFKQTVGLPPGRYRQAAHAEKKEL